MNDGTPENPEYRWTYTDMELQLAEQRFGWLARYYKPLKQAKVTNIYIAFSDDDPDYAFPIFEFESLDGRKFTCELLSMNDLKSPGIFTGLPIGEE
jgi:hypothetical protein